MRRAIWTARVAFLFAALLASAARGADHRGNVFVAGDDVRIPVPADWTGWRAIDVDGHEVAHGSAQHGFAELGKLPVGYFEVRNPTGAQRITAAVLAPSQPVADTPIAIDTAMAWFYSDPDTVRDICKMCRLAGVVWVRDRSSWPEIETARGTWADDGRYEQVMRLEHECGMKVLQVNHISPVWATANQARFPEDLQLVYEFYAGLAKRWKGLADAVEPWNEPDIRLFGGHTGCEIASFQKAAYLGLKSGDPKLPVCQSVFAVARAETLDEFGTNEVYPYFDLYDLHHYTALPTYPRVYARHRAVSGGRPMWTTEFNLMVNWADEETKEPSDEDLRVQGFRVSKVFAEALNEGPQKAFYFILGDYVERKLQFGLLHQDLTPRPAFVAFAAVGRLLNGAQRIGRVDLGNDKLLGYVFKTEVDGTPRETLVAWSETWPTLVDTSPALEMYDYLGRKLPLKRQVELTRSPVFMVLPRAGAQQLTLMPPPPLAEWKAGKACPVVLQLVGKGDVDQSSFQLDESRQLRLIAYNFGSQPARGKLVTEGVVGLAADIDLAPGEKQEQTIEVAGPGNVTVRLDLGDLGQAVVSARVTE